MHPDVRRAHPAPAGGYEHVHGPVVRGVDEAEQPACEQPGHDEVVPGVCPRGGQQLQVTGGGPEQVGGRRQAQPAGLADDPVAEAGVQPGRRQRAACEDAVVGELLGCGQVLLRHGRHASRAQPARPAPWPRLWMSAYAHQHPVPLVIDRSIRAVSDDRRP